MCAGQSGRVRDPAKFSGKAFSSEVNASRPPAEAPTPTIGKRGASGRGENAEALSTSPTLCRPAAFVTFLFVFFFLLPEAIEVNRIAQSDSRSRAENALYAKKYSP